MPEMFYFGCKTCKEPILLILIEDMYAWIDENGNFGLANVDRGITEGKPEGKSFPAWYSIRYCPQCGRTYTVVSGNRYGISLKKEHLFQSSGEKWVVYDNIKECPMCQIPLLTGREVLERVINRDQFRRNDYPPLEDLTCALKCPRCREDYLLYEKYFRMD